MATKKSGGISKITIRESDLKGDAPRLNRVLQLLDAQAGVTTSTITKVATQAAQAAVAPLITSSTGPLSLVLTSNIGYLTTPFQGALQATGGAQPYTYSIATGADCLTSFTGTLPDGLSLNTATGAISGTPTTVGASLFTGKVVDSAGTIVKVGCTITISTSTSGGLPVPGTVASATLAEPGPRQLQPDQSTHTTVSITPTITGGSDQQFITVYLSHDGGVTFQWQGYRPYVLGSGASITFDYYVFTDADCGDLTSDNLQAYAIDAQLGGGPASIPVASLPAGGAFTNTLTVLLAPPLATGVVASITNVAGAAATTENIYMGINSHNNPYATVIYTQTTPGDGDPNCAAYSVSVDWVDVDGNEGNPGGADNLPGEREMQEFPNDGNPHSWELQINYPSPGSPYCYLRFKTYGYNKNVHVSPPFKDTTGNVTLMACWPGAATSDSLQVTLVAVTFITAGDASQLPLHDVNYKPRYRDDNGGVHTPIWMVPTVSVLPMVVNVFVNEGDGNGWRPWSNFLLTTVGQIIYLPTDAWVPSTAQSWQISAMTGIYNSAGQFIPSLPAGACAPASFTLEPYALPLATDITTMTISAGAGGNHPYNATTPDGTQFFSIAQISVDTAPAIADPDAYYMRITAQDYGAGDEAIGPEQPFDGCIIDGLVHSFGPLMGAYGTQGGSYTRANPFPDGTPANLANVVLRVYVCNRIDGSNASFQNPLCATLQTDSGASQMILIALDGGIPDGVMDAGRIATGFGFGIHRKGSGWELNAGDGIHDDGTGAAAAYLAAPLSIVSHQIAIANGAIGSAYLASQAVTSAILANQAVAAINMAQNAVTYANAALAALAVVDSNMYSVAMNKVTYGTTVFAGPVVLSRGNGYPLIYLNYDNITLFSSCTASGSAGTPGTTAPSYTATGLTSSPYAVIQSGSIGLYSGGTGVTNAAATISASGLTFWSVSGNTGYAYATLNYTGLTIYSGSFTASFYATGITLSYGTIAATLSSTSLKLAYTGSVYALLASAGLVFVNGTYVVNIGNAGYIQLWSVASVDAYGNVTGNSAYPCVGITTSQFTITAGSTNITLASGGAAFSGTHGTVYVNTSDQLGAAIALKVQGSAEIDTLRVSGSVYVLSGTSYLSGYSGRLGATWSSGGSLYQLNFINGICTGSVVVG